MAVRVIGSFCSLLVLWLCALAGAPANRPAKSRADVRSTVELALRDVIEAPRLAPRAMPRSAAVPRFAERTAPSVYAPLPARQVALLGITALATRTTLDRQAAAHAARPRWRAYDAAAPPRLARPAR